MNGFGRRLAWLRKRAGMTQAQFAERIGTNIAMISLYEHEKTAPSVPRLQTMADVFGVSMDALWRGKRRPKDGGK